MKAPTLAFPEKLHTLTLSAEKITLTLLRGNVLIG
jgi:hypothetical protein